MMDDGDHYLTIIWIRQRHLVLWAISKIYSITAKKPSWKVYLFAWEFKKFFIYLM